MRTSSGWKMAAVAALAATALWACWDFDADRAAYCARPGAFCFDGGTVVSPEGDAGVDAGTDAGSNGAADTGPTDAGMDAGTPDHFVLNAVGLGSTIRDEWVNAIAATPNGAVQLAIMTAGGSTELQYGTGVGDPVDGVVGEVSSLGEYAPQLDLVGPGDQFIRALAVTGENTFLAGSLGDAGTFDAQSVKLPLSSDPGTSDGFLARLQTHRLMDARPISTGAPQTEVMALNASSTLVAMSGRQLSGEVSNAFIRIDDAAGEKVSTSTDCAPGTGGTAQASFDAVTFTANADDVVAGGYAIGDCTLDGQSFSSSYQRGLLARFSVEGGTLLSMLRLGSGNGSKSSFTAVASQPGTRTVFAAGTFEGSVNIIGGPYTAVGSTDGFVLVASAGADGGPDITPIASLHFGSNRKLTGLQLAVTDDAVYVSGGFRGQMQVGTNTYGDASGSSAWGFVARLTHSLEVTWVRTWGGVSETDLTPAGVAIDTQGDVVVAGSYAEPFEVDGESLTNIAQPQYQSQIYVLWMKP